MTVSAASTLAYNNTTNTTQSLTVQTGSMVLDAALTVQNISANTTLVNNINITRNMTGTGDLIVDTYNNVADGAVAFSNGRVQLSGDNTAWGGDLIIAKGTAQYSGANSLGGSGSITIGTTGDAFGAALGFNTGNTSQTLSKAITVTTGGIRLIRNNSGPGTAADLTLSGPINLEGDLTVDHAGLGAGNSITFSGGLTGVGGLNVTFVGPHPITDSSVRLTGTNTYLGETAVSSGTLILGTGTTLASTSIRVATAGTLNVVELTNLTLTIASGNRIGGDGIVAGSLALDAGARFVFSMTSTLDVNGSVTLDNSFSVASLVNADGTAIDWSAVSDGSYTLIGAFGSDFSNISNFGSGNLGSLGAGKSGYFENAAGLTGLSFVVVPEPQVCVLIALGLASVFFFRLRRRSA